MFCPASISKELSDVVAAVTDDVTHRDGVSQDFAPLFTYKLGVCAIPEPAGQIAVLVLSCDKYADLWGVFFRLFRRFWPDCPYNVYFLSNKISVDIPGVRNLLVGEDISWSDSLFKGLGQLNEAYVLLFLDDLFLYDYVNTREVNEVFNWILECRPNCVRMNRYVDNFRGSQGPDKPCNTLVGLISKGLQYRVSSVLTLWRTDVLRNILKSKESIWEFEIFGSKRADGCEDFYSAHKNYFPVINGVVGGKWRKSAVKKLASLGVDIDLKKRKEMTISQTTMLYLKAKRSLLLNFFPPAHRRKIRDFVLGGGQSCQRS